MTVLEVGGINGVGKTTVIREAIDRLNVDVPIIKGSSIMASYLGVTPKEIYTVSVEDRERARQHMESELRRLDYGVRDSHFCVYTSQGFEYPDFINDADLISAVVLVTASAATVRQRRATDPSPRRPTDQTSISAHLKKEYDTGLEGSAVIRKPFIVIRNEPGDNAADVLARVIKVHIGLRI